MLLLGLDLCREHLGEQLDRRRCRRRDAARRVVMTGDQAPEPAVAQDRHGQRCRTAHVAQVLNVDRRGAAKRREAEVEWRALGCQHRDNGDRLVVDGRDHPQPLTLEQRPRLRRDIGGRVVQPHERRHAGTQRLGDHLAAVVGQELVDHHAVEAGDGADLARGGGQEALEIRGAAQTIDDRLDQRGRIGAHRLRAFAGQEFGDGERSGGVDEDLVGNLFRADLDVRQALGEAGDHRRLERVAQIVDDLRRQDRLGRRANHGVAINDTEGLGGVPRDVGDRPGRQRKGDQAPERLDGAWNVDRLARALRNIDRRGIGAGHPDPFNSTATPSAT